MIRHATDVEIADAAKQIARSTISDTRFVRGFGPFTQVGPFSGNGVHRKILLRGLELSAREVLGQSVVLTLEVDGEPVGWVAFRMPTETVPLTIVFVHVIDLVRRRGFGRQLLQQALAFRDERAPRFSYMTRSGAALLRASDAETV
jgi:hypothetical protein